MPPFLLARALSNFTSVFIITGCPLKSKPLVGLKSGPKLGDKWD